jgi:hypothetical protein
MEERVSVGSSFSEAGFVSLVCLAVLGIIGGLTIVFFQPVAGGIIAGVGLLFAMFSLLRGIGISRGRRWITPSDEGFLYEDRNGEFDFRDEDIVEMGTWAKVLYSNGVPKSVRRDGNFVLSTGEHSTELKYSYGYPIAKHDPLMEFIDRNLERLTTQSVEQIANGEPLAGTSWELNNKELISNTKQSNEAFPVTTLTAAEVVDDHVNVWIRGEPKPVFRVPAGSPNALVLLRTLNKQFEKSGVKPDEDEPGLGRIIFERDATISMTVCIATAIIGGLMFLGGLVAVYFATQERNPTGPAILAAALIILGPGIAFAVWANRINVMRCHVRGVSRLTTKTTKQLEYKDVRVFSYSATRQYVNGAYTGTTISMTFEPDEESDLKRIHYSTTLKKVDGELDNLCNHVSMVMAQHMKTRLDAGEDVPWTDGLTFTPDGLELRIAGGILSKGKHRVLPYLESAFSLHEGYFYLFERGEKNSLYSIPVSQANFFPGYTLLSLLAYPPRPKEVEDEQPDKPKETEEKTDEIPRVKPVRREEDSMRD